METQCIVCLCDLDSKVHFHSPEGGIYCEDHAPDDAVKCGERTTMTSDSMRMFVETLDEAKLDANKVQAEAELVQMRAMCVLLGNGTLAVSVNIAGMEIYLSETSNKALKMILAQEMIEIKKFLSGKENTYKI